MKKSLFPLCYAACLIIYLGIAFSLVSVKDKESTPALSAQARSAVSLYAESNASPPETSAKAAVVIDGLSGAVLYEKNSSEKLPMASTTKIMTAKIILEKLPLERLVTVTKASTLVEGTSIYLRENEKITVETLLYGLLLESGNDAAHALAVALSGSIEDFATLMNEEANAMGLTSSSFANPHGLSDDNHYTTAYELGFIASEAMKNEKFREIVSSKKHLAPSLDGELTRYFSNHNKLLWFYDGAVGVKTGFTKKAGRCLVSAAERDGKRFIAVTLNDGNDWNDHRNMLDFAFNNYNTVKIAEKGDFSVYLNNVTLSNPDDIYITVPAGISPVIEYTAEIQNNNAYVTYFADGNEMGKFPLLPQ